MPSQVQFANFSIPLVYMLEKYFLRDPKLPNVIAYFVELFLFLIGTTSCILFLATLRRSKCFHSNLNLLLCNFTFNLMILGLSRYMITVPLILSYFLGHRVDTIDWCRIGKSLHDISIYFAAMDMLVLSIERSVATIFVRIYERNDCIWLSVILLILQYTFGITILVMNHMTIVYKASEISPCLKEYLNGDILFAFAGFIFLSDLIAIVVFLYLLHLNKQRYSENAEMLGQYFLSERYQIVENVRSTRLLYPLMVGFLIVSLLAIFLLLFLGRVISRFMYTTDYIDLTWSLCGQSYDILLSSYTIVFPWLALKSHRKLRKNSTLIMRSINKRLRSIGSVEIRPLPNQKPHQIHDLNGKSLVPLNSNDQTNVYFQNLQDSWNK